MFAALVLTALITFAERDSDATAVAGDINAHRAESRMHALILDPDLTAIARDRATDMVRRRYFAHVSPDGKSAIDALRSRDIPFAYAGENLASAETVRGAEAELWASIHHRDNMLERHYRRIGVAVVRTADAGNVVVEIFTD